MAHHGSWTGHRLLGACALLAILLPSAAPRAAERLPIKIYSTADGLAHNTVTRIVRDSHGFLWFCTTGGLSRFDGYSFRNFGPEQGLPHSSVYGLLETRNGDYWVATGAGVVRFDPDGRNTSGSPMFETVLPAGATGPFPAARALFEDSDGTIWVATSNGLFRLLHAAQRTLEPVDLDLGSELRERDVRDVIEDDHGTLWVASSIGLHRRWRDGSHALYAGADGLPTANISDLFRDRRGHLWAGTRDAGFFRFRADASHRSPEIDPALRDGVSSGWVYELFETSTGRFLLGTTRGFHQLLPDGESGPGLFNSYGPNAGIADHDVTAFAEDLAGNLWLGTGSAGTIRIARGGFTTYGGADWIKDVSAAFEDRAGRICFKGQILGDRNGTVFESKTIDLLRTGPTDFHTRYGCLDERGFEWFVPKGVENAGWVQEGVTLRAKDGEWWVGTGLGLLRYPAVARFTDLADTAPTARYGFKDGIVGEQIYRLFEDSAGNVWISSTSTTKVMGLAVWDRATARIRDLERSPGLEQLSHVWTARSFAEDRTGSVWIGFDGQLARYSEGRFVLFTAEDGVPPGAIRQIHRDHAGRLWLATAQSGLTRMNITSDGRPRFTSLTTANGLSSNNLRVITEDRDGLIYTDASVGLDRFDPETGRVQHFAEADGLQPGVLNSAFRDRHGALWFGTSNGVARLAPGPQRPTSPPPVMITALRVAGNPWPVSAVGATRITLPALAPADNNLQVDFVGLGFGPGEVLRYQYRLGGSDAAWSVPSERRSITYGRLSSDEYEFAVRAVTDDGVFSTTPAIVTFRILSPIWQRWWFVSSVICAAALAVYAGVRYRVARLMDVANMRTQIATELHDDLGANLTRIALLSEVAVQTQDSAPLSSIARIARESVSAMSDIVWAVNPRRETLLDLTRRMRQHADELLTLRGIELTFTTAGGNENRRLGADLRRDLLLTFKEAVHNAARHSGCTAVQISLVADRRTLTLAVSDNGRGFDALTESEGQGLTNMRKRARRLGGDLEIRTAPGIGTTITLRVPS